MEKLKKKRSSLEDLNQLYASEHQELRTFLSHIVKKLKMEVPALSETQPKAKAKASKKSVQSDEKEPSSSDDEKSVESLLAGVLNTLEKLLERFNESEQCSKELFSSLEKVVTELIGLQKKTFDLQQEWLRELRVVSGSRDYVSMFRYAAFRDVCLRDNIVAEKYETLDSYMSALTDENRACQLERGRARPLHDKWIVSVQQLGLSLDEWRLLRKLSTKSVSEFHNKFSLAELEAEVFPASFEKYRVPLLKVAKKLKELGAEEEKPDEEFLG